MNVVELEKTYTNYCTIIDMARHHPYPEYDCSFKEWADAFWILFRNPNARCWVAVDEVPCGYVIGIRDRVFRNQISVFDIYLEPSYRGKNLITLLVSQLRDWAIEDKAKRIQWTSKFNAEKWQRILEETVTGIKVDEYKTLNWEVT
jgi:GNAT superfamily N-acetyltransferase